MPTYKALRISKKMGENISVGYFYFRRTYIFIVSKFAWLPFPTFMMCILLGGLIYFFLGQGFIFLSSVSLLSGLIATGAIHMRQKTYGSPVSRGEVAHINLGLRKDLGRSLLQRKTQVDNALVTFFGVAGDEQSQPLIKIWGGHGGLQKAVMLFSTDEIQQINKDGHPNVGPGTCGEQITIKGVDWRKMKTASRVKIGDDVLLEVTLLKGPCRQQLGDGAPFTDDSVCCSQHTKNADVLRASDYLKGSVRIHPSFHPHSCRVHTRVLRQGYVKKGDDVLVFQSPNATLNVKLTHFPREGALPGGCWMHTYH